MSLGESSGKTIKYSSQGLTGSEFTAFVSTYYSFNWLSTFRCSEMRLDMGISSLRILFTGFVYFWDGLHYYSSEDSIRIGGSWVKIVRCVFLSLCFRQREICWLKWCNVFSYLSVSDNGKSVGYGCSVSCQCKWGGISSPGHTFCVRPGAYTRLLCPLTIWFRCLTIILYSQQSSVSLTVRVVLQCCLRSITCARCRV